MAEIVAVAVAAYTALDIIVTLKDGLEFIIGLSDRVEYAFSHAKTRTKRLIEAAKYTESLVKLFEGTVGELQTLFDQDRRPHLEPPLLKLKEAVAEAHTLMAYLDTKRNRAVWFLLGDGYREKITQATNDVSICCLISDG